ncbi:acyltransferase family protein [Rhizorhabdus argentea]|uniref:acyltransferase family protein n=1 Tax=Rhizorhabdus argentea TaxID=1387174 RepID=UPI0030EBC3DC
MEQTGSVINVQVLRAVAASMVVFYHARLMTPIGEILSFDFGNAGVDVFFLISGFIIVHVSRRSDIGAPRRFLAKRAIRILPLYWLLTLMLFAISQVHPALSGSGGQPDLVMLAKSLTFVPYYNGGGEIHPVLFMGWTLNFEVFFYIVFAAALLIRSEITRLLSVSGAFVTLTLIGFLLVPSDAIGTTYTSPLMLEFVIGMWMNVVYRRLGTRQISGRATALLLMFGAASLAALVYGDYGWPDAPREVKWGVPACGVVASALLLEKGQRTIGWRWLMLLGEASYAMYLVHPFVIKGATLFYRRLDVQAFPVHCLALLGLYVIIAGIGIAFHLLVEKPTVRWFRQQLVPLASHPAVTGAAAVPVA